MKSFSEVLAEDRRLVILRLLKKAPNYSLNDRLVREGLKQLGHNLSLDAVRADLAWLQDVGALTTENTVADVHVATISRRGAEHVELAATIPGVKRPSPGGAE